VSAAMSWRLAGTNPHSASWWGAAVSQVADVTATQK
jgi:threonine/homoserine/homoserine lactone efflux protein